MFTPHRNTPFTPPSSALRTTTTTGPSRFTVADKGKAVAFVDGPPPPPPPLSPPVSENFRRGESNDDWKRFKEAGLLDEVSLEEKDRQELRNKISKLEKELFDYQYNMGLLLIENKDLASKSEELGQEFVDAQEMLKREKTAHLIAISEAEQREENLKKAMGIEKKRLADLERALRDMNEEHAKFRALSETAVADVNNNMETLEKKRLELEAKTHLADSKLAAAERKNSEVDRKLQDLEARERILQRQCLSLAEEKEAHLTNFHKHKKDLIEWERKLQEGEQRLSDGRRTLKEREEKLHETDRISKEKEAYMDELQQKIDSADATLKNMERDIEIKLADLDSKEKKAGAVRCKLEMTERKLIEKEERLNARESVELENLLNRHKAELDAKMRGYELEMKEKRSSMDEELSIRMQEIDARKSEINHLEEMLGKREQTLDKKSERVKEKEKDVDGKMKALKEREKSLISEEQSVKLAKKEIITDKESLEVLKTDLELRRTNMRKQELQIEEERKELDTLQEERYNYLRLQTDLKQEIEIARRQSELIEKEAVDLKLEREKFEKDWEALDEKRAVVDDKLKMLAKERASFEKLKTSEEDMLKKERSEREENIRVELERIRLERESFEATMEHEKKLFDEKVKNERSLLVQDLERERSDFYNDFKRRQKELEEMMEEKERSFVERKLREMQNLSHLKEDAEREKEDMETERRRFEKESQEMELTKKQLDEARVGMSADVEALDNLSKTIKKQREEIANERRSLFAFIEQIKGCRSCGDSAQAFLHRDIQIPDLEGSSHFQSPPVAVIPSNLKLGGQMSVLRKCAAIIFKSPTDRSQPIADRITEESPSSANRASSIPCGSDEVKIRTEKIVIDECGPSSGMVDESFKNSQSDFIVREDTIDASAEQSVQDSENTNSKPGKRKPVRKRGPGVRRTHSVKAVVEDAKAILGAGSVRKMEVGHTDFTSAEANRQQESGGAGKIVPASARKRSRSQASTVAESEQSEGIADSASTDGRRKRRQTGAAAVPTLGQRRYNLRRHTAVENPSVEQGSSGKPKNENEVANKGTVQNADDMPAQSLDVAVDSGSRLNVVQVSTTRSIEITSDRIVRFATTDLPDVHFDAAKSQEKPLLSGEANSGENTLMIDEVNVSKDGEDGDDSSGGVDEEVGDEDDSDGHPGQASIGKQLWKFFTT